MCDCKLEIKGPDTASSCQLNLGVELQVIIANGLTGAYSTIPRNIAYYSKNLHVIMNILFVAKIILRRVGRQESLTVRHCVRMKIYFLILSPNFLSSGFQITGGFLLGVVLCFKQSVLFAYF